MSYNPATQNQTRMVSYEARPGRGVHSVKPGETLDSIARQYGTTSSALIGLNSHQLGSNGSGLQPGMRLEI
jgi:LysM repeat protein